MLAQVTSCAVIGLDGALVDVEVYLSTGQPGLTKAVPHTQSKFSIEWQIIGKIGGHVESLTHGRPMESKSSIRRQ